MRKVAVIFASFLLLFVFTVAVKASSHRIFKLPPNAKQIAPNVYDLGVFSDKGKTIQGLLFVHPKPKVGFDHKDNHKKGGGGNGKGGGETVCYDYIANGTRWRNTEPYYLDPENGENYLQVEADVEAGMSEWEKPYAAGFNIFGVKTGVAADVGNTLSYNEKNEIMFGDFVDSNAIAVAAVWYTRGGPPWAREILEYDIMFNDFYQWGDAKDIVDTPVMDFRSIATHELGHGAGMGDLYDSVCNLETMYGYASKGETNKRDLHDGDKLGISKLYK